jgi:soluble lytic murein transglycosylase-like protein
MNITKLSKFTLAALLLVCLTNGQSVYADIHSYVDSNGNLWLTNGSVQGKKNVKLLKRTPKKANPAAAKSGSGTRVYNAKISCGSHQRIHQKTKPYLSTIRKYANNYGVEEHLVRALIRQESCFNPKALSHAGAQGLMQLMPGTADMMGVSNAMSPKQNIRGGVKYLSRMLRRFGGNKELALAAYNAGPGAVDKYNGIPPYRETRNYVVKVMSEYQRLTGQAANTDNLVFARSGKQ